MDFYMTFSLFNCSFPEFPNSFSSKYIGGWFLLSLNMEQSIT